MSKIPYHIVSLLLLLCFSCDNKSQTQTSTQPAEGLVEVSYETDEDGYISKGLTNIPVATYGYMLKGRVGNYKCYMRLRVDSTDVQGEYKYENKENGMSVEGTIKDGHLEMEESFRGTTTGRFSGTFDHDKHQITGTWTSADGERTLPFYMENYYGIKDFPQHSFKTNLMVETYDDGYQTYKMTELYVYDKSGKELNYKITGFESNMPFTAYGITLEDYNFDGYPDIALMEFVPSYLPCKLLFFLYDTELEEYIQTDILEEVYTIPDEIDPENKTVTTNWHKSGDTGSMTYKYQDGNYYIIKRESDMQTEDGDCKSTTTHYKIENGQSIEIKK